MVLLDVTDSFQNVINKSLEAIVAKTIAAFLNCEGGILVIGVDDNKEIIGLEKDFSTLRKRDEDGFELKLTEIMNNYIGKEFRPLIHVSFEHIDSKTVCTVEVEKSPKAAYVNSPGRPPDFYIRSGNSSEALDIKQATDYIVNHWRKT